MGKHDKREVSSKEEYDAFCRLVQFLYEHPLEESEKHVQYCFKIRYKGIQSRAFDRRCVRDAIKMLRLHRAVLNSSPEELRQYGVNI